MSLTPLQIPDNIDGPPFLLFMEMDEFGFIVVIIFACLFTHTNFFVMIGLLFVFYKFYVQFKKKSMDGFYIHYPYRWGIVPLNKYFRNGSIMEYKE
ncbi:type IV conjugative transfer system protein TraL [Acinetobacter sp. P1(2025)]|uniref:type IV conjugative transfer system protein TraL n=1 Tax=Acinetobacter sp. P1(2025) TaxID=3446120 RepID=UPI003F53B576